MQSFYTPDNLSRRWRRTQDDVAWQHSQSWCEGIRGRLGNRDRRLQRPLTSLDLLPSLPSSMELRIHIPRRIQKLRQLKFITQSLHNSHQLES
jgi:hypothetical protein